jgi:hypothetical protein
VTRRRLPLLALRRGVVIAAMRIVQLRVAFVLALVTTTAACPLDEDGDGDGTNYVAVGDMPAAYKDAYCTFLTRCGLFPDKATCVGAALSVVGTIDPNLVAAVGAGRVFYNGSNVKACYDAFANDTCDQTDENGRARIPACGVYFTGTVAGGDACILDQECISQQCSGGDSGVSCVRGTCVGDTPPAVLEPIAVGMPCVGEQPCTAGAYCDTTTDVCTVFKTNGEACTGSTECGYGLACAGPSGARVCQPLPALGQPCRLDLPCRDEGQTCNSTTMTCQQVGVAGAACTSGLQCSPYYRCNFTTSMCTKGPSLGESCSTGTGCFDAGTHCSSTSLTCVPLEADGAPCSFDGECASDRCDVNTSTCSSPPLCF